ncbi:hypothetical protein ACRRTK_016450 [Alexandromys fortis]
MLRRKKGAVASPSSSRMMAGSEIPDGSSLMSSQLHVGVGIRPSSFSSTFFISSPPKSQPFPSSVLRCTLDLNLIKAFFTQFPVCPVLSPAPPGAQPSAWQRRKAGSRSLSPDPLSAAGVTHGAHLRVSGMPCSNRPRFLI